MKKKQPIQELSNKTVQITYPLSIISAISILLYIKSLNFGLTHLDDTIFINDFNALFSDIKNLPHLFFRGVFFETTDSYYRPLLMVSFMYDKLISGNLFAYHLTNLLFHISSCILLYVFFVKFKIRSDVSFILALLFTVHPVLSQAVVWIPGRNDSMLTTFVLASLIYLINYSTTKKWHNLFFHFLFLALALFTKESGIILPIIALSYLVLFENRNLKNNIIIFLGWIAIGVIWFYMRSISIEPIIKPTLSEYTELFISRLPLFIQYIGKSILPFNLSVFPMQADTTIYLGLIAIILIALLIFIHKTFNKKMVLFGFAWFTFFLLPAFFVPTEINEQAFEHRLYLPIIGLFIILSESVLFSESNIPNQKITFWSFIGIAILFVGINYGHQQKFKNEITFWENAAIDSPSSSYAHKMLGIKYFNKKLYDKSNEEIKRAFELDSTERYVNFYYAKNVEMKNEKDPKIEYYLLQEEEINPGFVDNLFELARVNFEKGDKKIAKYYLQECIRVAPKFMSAKNNLLLLLIENGEKQEAVDYINQWKKDKSGIPDGLEKEVNKM